MSARWFILADDLTGAADCAIAFAKRGLHTVVRWQGEPETAGEAVLSYDANSRGLSAQEAAARHAFALAALHQPGARLVKKIDSTLRGQPVSELAATLAHLRAQTGAAFGILAPAFPGTGRTTEGGRIRVNGRPLEEAEVWRRDHTYASADLPAILAEGGIRAERVGLETVRGGPGALHAALAGAAGRAEVAVCDAVSEDDLARIAAASCEGEPLSPGLVWIGSGGLAQALAGTCEIEAAPPPPLAAKGRGTLIVVGSLAEASRAAARKLTEAPGLRHVPIDPALALAHPAALAPAQEAIAAGLIAGEDVLVEVTMGSDPDLAQGPAIADALARLLAPAARHADGLMATGGETAAALLARWGVDGLRLIDETEPGVSLGLTLGAISVPIVTKAGAFGDEGTLLRALHRLRTISRQGSFA